MNTTATGLAGFENSSGEEDRENQQLYKLSLDRLTEWSGFEGKVRWCTANILGHPINLNPAIPNPLSKNVFEGPFKVTEKKASPQILCTHSGKFELIPRKNHLQVPQGLLSNPNI